MTGKVAPAKVTWQAAFLKSIKAPVTTQNVAFLTSWWKQEGGDLTNNARFNWLNTTHGSQFPSINSVGVRSYPNFQTGINMLKAVFSYYPNLTRSLRSGSVDLNNPGVQADLNKWLSGNASPGMSQYVSRIAHGMGGSQPSNRDSVDSTPAQPLTEAQRGLQSVTEPSVPYVAPRLDVPAMQVGTPLAEMPGVPKIAPIQFKAPTVISGPSPVTGQNLPSLKVVHDAPQTKGDSATSEILDLARQYLGTKYVFGGASPKTGFDCSGFVQWLYKQVGVSLPRTTYEQVHVGTPVSVKQLKPGDIVFFEPSSRGPGHEALYIGGGKVIQAPHTGDVVRITPLSQMGSVVAARRVMS